MQTVMEHRVREEQIAALIQGVDLFCGVGGLTNGLESVGIDVRLGIDIDPDCEYPYTANNKATFLLKSIEDVEATEVLEALGGGDFTLLAGCAPCQPFSTYSRPWSGQSDKRWHLLEHFSRLIREVRPHFVTMENVPLLERESIFSDFLATLEHEGYEFSYSFVNCADYGIPQRRKRLVLLASRLGKISLIKPTTPKGHHLTVRRAIGKLPPLEAGERSESDPIHQACKLSPLNLQRIRASRPGGSWQDWDKSLIAKCHQKPSGRSYGSVYGRMVWDEPSPTMTTQFNGFGNGRFGHPEQDRAISLREGAILQSFPGTYEFVPENSPIKNRTIARLIGNAVPVNLGAIIGRSIVCHVKQWLELQKLSA